MVPLIFGGGQEKGLRAGTYNVPSIVGMAKAAQISLNNQTVKIMELKNKRNYFIKRVLKEIPYSRLNGTLLNRLPGNINFAFQFVSASELLAMLDINGVCASSASACQSESGKPSHVLKAMGLSEELSGSSVRFSISDDTTYDDINYVADKLKELIAEMRKDNEIIRYYNGNNK